MSDDNFDIFDDDEELEELDDEELDEDDYDSDDEEAEDEEISPNPKRLASEDIASPSNVSETVAPQGYGAMPIGGEIPSDDSYPGLPNEPTFDDFGNLDNPNQNNLPNDDKLEDQNADENKKEEAADDNNPEIAKEAEKAGITSSEEENAGGENTSLNEGGKNEQAADNSQPNNVENIIPAAAVSSQESSNQSSNPTSKPNNPNSPNPNSSNRQANTNASQSTSKGTNTTKQNNNKRLGNNNAKIANQSKLKQQRKFGNMDVLKRRPNAKPRTDDESVDNNKESKGAKKMNLKRVRRIITVVFTLLLILAPIFLIMFLVIMIVTILQQISEGSPTESYVPNVKITEEANSGSNEGSGGNGGSGGGSGNNGSSYKTYEEQLTANTLFVGDSRISELESVVGSDAIFVTTEEANYAWLTGSATGQIDSYISNGDTKFVIFSIGLYDLDNASKYISTFRSLSNKYSHVKFYFTSVNYVQESRLTNHEKIVQKISNARIKLFNSQISSALGNSYINISGSASSNDTTNDGIHFSDVIYKLIYNIMMKFVKEDNPAPATVACALRYDNGTFYITTYPQTESCGVPRFNENELGLEPHFYDMMMSLLSDAERNNGCTTTFSETYRSREQQEYFYNCYITQSCNNGNLAAVPGTSRHEYGIAADLRYSSDSCSNYIHNNASKYGLHFNVPGEPWHIEPINIK